VNAPIVYEVDRARDGGSFSSRRVVAIQHGRQIFNMAASFHIAESGLERMRDRVPLAFEDVRMVGPDLRIKARPKRTA